MISREAIKTRFKKILSTNESPHRISLAFAIGIFIAFSPTIGLHTVSAIAAAWLFELNLPVVMVGTLVNNPWTFLLVYGVSICFGGFILNDSASCLPAGLGKEELLIYLKYVPLPFVTGTIVLGIIAAIISYFSLYQVLVIYKKGKKTPETVQ